MTGAYIKNMSMKNKTQFGSFTNVICVILSQIFFQPSSITSNTSQAHYNIDCTAPCSRSISCPNIIPFLNQFSLHICRFK